MSVLTKKQKQEKEKQEESNRIEVKDQKTDFGQNFFSPMISRVSSGIQNLVKPVMAGFSGSHFGGFGSAYAAEQAGLNAIRNAGGKKTTEPIIEETPPPPPLVVEVDDSSTPPKKVLSGETNILSNQKPIAGNLYENSRESITPSNSFTSNMNSMGGDISKQKADMEAMFKSSNNKTTSSKTRGGLFGNYGKKVEIRKTFDKSTGRTNKQKFIDGELASDRNARQDVRRKGRSTDARSKRKAGRNK
jgi:hypothetical protein